MAIRAAIKKRAFLAGVAGLVSGAILTTVALVAYQLGQTANGPSLVATTTPNYLRETEVVVIEPNIETEEPIILPVEETGFQYVVVTSGCDIHFEGECLLVRSGPGTDFEQVARLRNDMVLKVGGQVERDGETWYKIVFDEWLRYPERVESDWYVAADYVEILYDEGDKTIWDDEYTKGELGRIVIDLGDQVITAWADDQVVMQFPISSGLKATPTPRGTFTIFKKTPSRYMQGPLPGLPGDQFYDLPGVPWNLYFTQGGAVIHGAYWHDSFGSTYSHGCVNLDPADARELYEWAELGMTVVVQD